MSWIKDVMQVPICSVCHQNPATRYLSDGYICDECIALCAPHLSSRDLKKTPTELVLRTIQENIANAKRANAFRCTQSVENFFAIDEYDRLWYSPIFSMDYYFDYDSIVSFDLVKDEEIVTESSGGLGGALLGHHFAGATGAIMGAMADQTHHSRNVINGYGIQIETSTLYIPEVYIDCMVGGKPKNHAADKILSILASITGQSSAAVPTSSAAIPAAAPMQESHYSVADELMKLKTLLDQGALTQAEFDELKKQLMGSH